MSDYLLVLCVFLVLFHQARGTSPALSNIILIEVSLSFLIKLILKDLSLFTTDNIALIIILRNAFILLAAVLLYVYRRNIAWRIMLLLYTAAFLYNTMTFVELSIIIDPTLGYFYANYGFFGKLIITSIIINLLIQSFGGGIKNYLGNRIFVNDSRSNPDNSSRSRLRYRNIRRWTKTR